jgi:microcystin-dependent protein
MAEPYIGEIRMWGGTFAPLGWEFCNGQLLPIANYDALYALLGTTYGGDGQVTFALPNLQSRIPLHAGPQFPVGTVSGAETVTLTVNQLAQHSHLATGSSGPASSTSPANAVPSSWSDGQYATGTPHASMAVGAVSGVGGNQPHDNLSPYVAITFIIATSGIFPSQN